MKELQEYHQRVRNLFQKSTPESLEKIILGWKCSYALNENDDPFNARINDVLFSGHNIGVIVEDQDGDFYNVDLNEVFDSNDKNLLEDLESMLV